MSSSYNCVYVLYCKKTQNLPKKKTIFCEIFVPKSLPFFVIFVWIAAFAKPLGLLNRALVHQSAEKVPKYLWAAKATKV
jgi:hypothetical protein